MCTKPWIDLSFISDYDICEFAKMKTGGLDCFSFSSPPNIFVNQILFSDSFQYVHAKC